VRFKVFTAVKIQVKVFWVVTPCSVVVGYHFTLKMETAKSSKTLVSYNNITWHYNPDDNLSVGTYSTNHFTDMDKM
jgi:hypothetical protein